MRAPLRLHRWVWQVFARCPAFGLHKRRCGRCRKSVPHNRVSLRLEECERLELPGSILSVGTALSNVSLVQTANAENSSVASWQHAPPSAFIVNYGDTDAAAAYNAGTVPSAVGDYVSADPSAEARPAMQLLLSEDSEPIGPRIAAESEPAFADPFQLTEFADVLPLDPLFVGALAIGDTTSLDAAATSAATTDTGSGGSLASGSTATSTADPSSTTTSAVSSSSTTDSSATFVVSSGTSSSSTLVQPTSTTTSSTDSGSATTSALAASTSPTPPPPPAKPKPPPADPLDVLDANTAQTVLPGVTAHGFSTWAMDLRAQVQGGTVQTYSWNLTSAPDATSVTGASTYRLQFTWASFTGTARTDTITITTTNTDQTVQSRTITFKVHATDSPAWTATPPTTVNTWPTVVTPDEVDLDQATAGNSKYYQVGLATGELLATHMLPAYAPHTGSCGCCKSLELASPIFAANDPDGGRLHLAYSSLAADARPIFIYRFQLDPTRAVPA